MSERNEYVPGEFNWVDLMTTDVDAAKDFYAGLLGCDANAAPGDPEETGGSGFFQNAGRMIAGFGPVMSDEGHPAWNSYVCVTDADETAAKAKEAGGTVVMGPIDLPNDGRMLVLRDPEGAFISALQPGQHKGAGFVNEPGSWTWNQLATRDRAAAEVFYVKVFGWTRRDAPEAPPDSPFSMWQVGGQRWEEGLPGVMEMGEEIPAAIPAHWMVYFAVESAEDAISKTKEAGGQIMFGPEKIPVGILAQMTDAQGAAFGVIEPDYPAPR